MSENTRIEWADHTFNPWVGCAKVSPACDHCYAERWAKRTGDVQWGPHAERRRTVPSNWAKPELWNSRAAAFQAEHGRRQRVFCASLADVFDNQVPTAWRVDLLQLIADTPELDWLLLTKRIGNAHALLNEALAVLSHGITFWEDMPWPNVWLGATVCDQDEADRDIHKLRKVPARVRFLSVEPMLGPINLFTEATIGARVNASDARPAGAAWLDWVICGGESGPGARPMHPDWARDLRDQCEVAGVPFLFKQWGEWASVSEVAGTGPHHHFADGATARRTGKERAGRTLDGVEHNGFPEPRMLSTVGAVP